MPDMYDVATPPSYSGASLSDILDIVSNVEKYQDRIEKMQNYEKTCAKAYKKVKDIIPFAKKERETADAAIEKSKNGRAVLAKDKVDFAEARRAFEDYKQSVLNEIESERDQVEAMREDVAEREDVVDAKEKGIVHEQKALDNSFTALQKEKEEFRLKLEKAKSIDF